MNGKELTKTGEQAEQELNWVIDVKSLSCLMGGSGDYWHEWIPIDWPLFFWEEGLCHPALNAGQPLNQRQILTEHRADDENTAYFTIGYGWANRLAMFYLPEPVPLEIELVVEKINRVPYQSRMKRVALWLNQRQEKFDWVQVTGKSWDLVTQILENLEDLKLDCTCRFDPSGMTAPCLDCMVKAWFQGDYQHQQGGGKPGKFNHKRKNNAIFDNDDSTPVPSDAAAGGS